eukprot:gene3182-5498_t
MKVYKFDDILMRNIPQSESIFINDIFKCIDLNSNFEESKENFSISLSFLVGLVLLETRILYDKTYKKLNEEDGLNEKYFEINAKESPYPNKAIFYNSTMVKGEKNKTPSEQTFEMRYTKITKPKSKVCRRLFPKSETGTNLDDLYNSTIENFEKKWNFDVKNGKPAEGKFDWTPVENKN